MEAVPLWALTAAYAAHILEEYVLDWRGWTQRVSGMSLDWTAFFVANAAVIVLGICCSAVGFDCPWFSYLFVGLAAVNALFAHIGTTIATRIFSPGLITSVVLFLPLSIWAYVIAEQKGTFSLRFLGITLLGGFIIMSFPVGLQKLRQYLEKKNNE